MDVDILISKPVFPECTEEVIFYHCVSKLSTVLHHFHSQAANVDILLSAVMSGYFYLLLRSLGGAVMFLCCVAVLQCVSTN